MKFEELYLSDDILDAIDAMHFENCTPIQEQTIPLITEGKDVIAVAQTGTGKTAAYLLPVIDEIANGDYPQDAINCIIMAPTRELAQQIDRQMQGFAYYMPVSSVAIYGGTDGQTFDQQKKGLTLGADVVIATPGRLIAHLSMGYVDLSKVSFLILDEADRMLDMGFFDDIMQIVKHLPDKRQTLLFSATMPPKIKQLAGKILHDPMEVKLSVSKPADKIDQSAFICYETQKIPILRHIFKSVSSEKSIIFASSKMKCKELSKALRSLNLNVGEMHSDLDQSQRENVLLDFKSGKISILVATDIVARGIDIDDIGLVVNFDVPHEGEDYVHRVGRTARANSDGIAITFVSEKEIGKFKRIEKFIGKDIKKNPIPEEIGKGPEYGEVKEKSNDNKRKHNSKGKTKKEVIVKKEDEEVKNNTSDDNDKKRRKKNNRSKKSENQPLSEDENLVDEQQRDASANQSLIEEPQAANTTEEIVSDISENNSEVASEEKSQELLTEASQPNDTPEDSEEKKENDGEPKKKRKKKKKKKSAQSQEEDVEEEVDLGPDPYGDKPISYSLVSAMMVAEAREREQREKAERDARNAAKKVAEDLILQPNEEDSPDVQVDILWIEDPSVNDTENPVDTEKSTTPKRKPRNKKAKETDKLSESEESETTTKQQKKKSPSRRKKTSSESLKNDSEKESEVGASDSAEVTNTAENTEAEKVEPTAPVKKKSTSRKTKKTSPDPEKADETKPVKKKTARKKKEEKSPAENQEEA